MAFILDNWNTVTSGGRRGPGGAPSIFSYFTEDTIVDVELAGYFNDVKSRVSLHDMVYVRSNGGDRTELYTFGDSSLTNLVLNQKFPSSRECHETSILLLDASTTDGAFFNTRANGEITRISAVIDTGTVTGDTILTASIGATPITTDSPITLPNATGAGELVVVQTTTPGDRELTQGSNNVLKVVSDGASSTPFQVRVIFEIFPFIVTA